MLCRSRFALSENLFSDHKWPPPERAAEVNMLEPIQEEAQYPLCELVSRNAWHWALSSVRLMREKPMETVCDIDHAGEKSRPRKLFNDIFLNQLLYDSNHAARQIIEARETATMAAAQATHASDGGADSYEQQPENVEPKEAVFESSCDEDSAWLYDQSLTSWDELYFLTKTVRIIKSLMLAQLANTGQLDSALLNWNYLVKNSRKLRLLWAMLPSHSIVIDHVHDHLWTILPITPMSTYLSLLKFMKHHHPDSFRRVFVAPTQLDDTKSYKAPLLAFFDKRFSEKLVLTRCVAPLKRLDSDCLAILLSPSIRIAGESLNRAYDNCDRFYKLVFIVSFSFLLRTI
ncbi:unnamed protein product [Soboliphyme baturini]|uniref:SNF2_N domain-containing protein n=1 Tax=Soboliphyme baturini TaxID=241478 RepID=A0A183J4F8_9BILA|nr:unnamed protein product [Soboliphyme baturini]